jgi:mRNA interferase MazF
MRGIRSEVLLTPEDDGVEVDSVVTADYIQTVPKANLGNCLTHLSQDRMREVREAIEFALGFDALQ